MTMREVPAVDSRESVVIFRRSPNIINRTYAGYQAAVTTVLSTESGTMLGNGLPEDALLGFRPTCRHAWSRSSYCNAQFLAWFHPRTVFLATLRDNNSGHYFHPDLARRFPGLHPIGQCLSVINASTKEVVALPIEDLTEQLDLYVTTVPAPRERMIESWTKLKAYRATIPIDTDPIAAEIFFMKVEVAVAILEARLPGRIQ
jgi:hypothetical protein